MAQNRDRETLDSPEKALDDFLTAVLHVQLKLAIGESFNVVELLNDHDAFGRWLASQSRQTDIKVMTVAELADEFVSACYEQNLKVPIDLARQVVTKHIKQPISSHTRPASALPAPQQT